MMGFVGCLDEVHLQEAPPLALDKVGLFGRNEIVCGDSGVRSMLQVERV